MDKFVQIKYLLTIYDTQNLDSGCKLSYTPPTPKFHQYMPYGFWDNVFLRLS